ncbi:hypothetical protein EAY07_21165 [Vibrio anguillarum]|uniref:Uncharacterized protein n=1 Tax=Vibrio anguillarum TaxID=55601 RepID=A0ABD4KSV0_VIBAN|nr:hypothetical protein [Vibrio anguillarum]
MRRQFLVFWDKQVDGFLIEDFLFSRHRTKNQTKWYLIASFYSINSLSDTGFAKKSTFLRLALAITPQTSSWYY